MSPLREVLILRAAVENTFLIRLCGFQKKDILPRLLYGVMSCHALQLFPLFLVRRCNR